MAGLYISEIIDVGGRQIYGEIVKIDKEGWSEPLESCYLKAVSQEHGIVQLTASEFEKVNVGDVIGVLPAFLPYSRSHGHLFFLK